MTLLTIPRRALEGYIKLVRLPVDGMLALTGGGDSAAAVKLALDRVEATVRGAAGAMLGDDALRADARRRREAAGERERALRLRAEAERRSDRADDRIADRQTEADRRRARAAEHAQVKRDQAQRRRASTKSKAARSTQRRKQTARTAAVRAQEAIEERAKPSRLEQLDTKAEALEQRELALTVADEAQRLRTAASNAKANRKNGG
jgi:hypothetical protein